MQRQRQEEVSDEVGAQSSADEAREVLRVSEDREEGIREQVNNRKDEEVINTTTTEVDGEVEEVEDLAGEITTSHNEIETPQ